MGDLARRLAEQFNSHEQTAEGLLPPDADQQTVTLHRSGAQYVALKEALIQIARAIDELADAPRANPEQRSEARESRASARSREELGGKKKE